MQLLVVLAALMGVVLSARAAALLPADDRSNFHTNRVRNSSLAGFGLSASSSSFF